MSSAASDLDRGEGGDPAPAPQHGPQVHAQQRDRQQDRGPDRRPHQHQHLRRHLGHGDADEQVRDAPDDRHQPEQHQAAPGHAEMLGWFFIPPIFPEVSRGWMANVPG
jgi:hypothetical protein